MKGSLAGCSLDKHVQIEDLGRVNSQSQFKIFFFTEACLKFAKITIDRERDITVMIILVCFMLPEKIVSKITILSGTTLQEKIELSGFEAASTQSPSTQSWQRTATICSRINPITVLYPGFE